METELTKKIKQLTHYYKPKMNSNMRTIRWTDEVWTPNGIVDSIRFEDYVSIVYEECKRINFEAYLNGGDAMLKHLPSGALPLGQCKKEEQNYPCKDCKGCFYHVREVKHIEMMITCYEVKISLSDFKSGNAVSFWGNENYYCVPKDLVPKIKDLTPAHVGILEYYEGKSAYGLRKVKEPLWQEVEKYLQVTLLYNAMKKWCDGAVFVN